MARVDSMVTLLTSQRAEARNSQAWPRWGQYIWPNKHVPQNFADEIEYLKGWLNDRLAWMDQQLDYTPDSLLTGDVNGDGVVDIADVNIVINIMLGKDTPDGYPGQANVDGKAAIDIADVNMVINIMLGKE